MYKIIITKDVYKQIANLPSDMADKIALTINKLEENPRPAGVKKLKSYNNYYRIRLGVYRIVYSIEDRILVIRVIRVAHRKQVYL